MSNVAAVTDATFDAEVLGSAEPVVVDFWATWCGPCRQMAPVVDEVAGETAGAKFVKVDVDENPMTAARFGIKSIPTFAVFKGGEVAEMFAGAMPKAAFKARVEPHLA